MIPTPRALILATLLGSFACGGDEPGALPPPADSVEVTVSRAVTAGALESFPASVVAEREARVATRMSGTVVDVPVDVGTTVAAGQTLVELDGGDVRARVESARARAELARRSFRRIENLHEEGAASAQELDEARASLDQAEAGLRDARSQLEYVEVRAPFAGVVTARMVDPGDLAAPGRPLLRVVGGGAREVEADLPAEWSGRLAAGDPVQVRVGGDGAVLPARITRVSTALEPGSRRFRVEAAFQGEAPAGVDLTPGSYARLEVERPGSSGTGRWIPADAVIRRGQLTGVFAVEDGVLRLRWLRLGRTRGEAVEVLAGPPGSLEVVRRPAPTLADGQAVAGTEREAWAGPAPDPTAPATDGEGA